MMEPGLRRSQRRISVLLTTAVVAGLMLGGTTVAEAGRAGCKVTNVRTGASYAGLARAIKTAAVADVLSIANTCIGRFLITKSLTLSGASAAATLNGNGGGTVVFLVPGVTVTITQLTITGGLATSGGGIYNNGTLTLGSGVTVSGNQATNGGGIYNNRSLILGDGVSVSGNTGGSGGGIYNGLDGSVTIAGSASVSGNTANVAGGVGGGIYNLAGSVAISGSATVSGNTADTNGGGISNGANATLTLSGSASVTGNQVLGSGGVGGGIFTLGALTLLDAAAPCANTPDDVADPGSLLVDNSSAYPCA